MSTDDRKPRVDSPSEAVNTMLAATRVIEPPEELDLDGDEIKQFNNIINEFAKVTWTPHTTVLAGMLARTICQAMEDGKLLGNEGTVIENARGNPCLNPRVSAINSANSSILQMRRSLALHATAGVSKKDAGNRAVIQRDQDAGSPLHDDDEELLARPPSHVVN